MTNKRIWLPTFCIALALLAPATTYMVVASSLDLPDPESGPVYPVGDRIDGPLTVITTGNRRWACVLMQNSRLSPIVETEPVTQGLTAQLLEALPGRSKSIEQ